MEKIILLSPLKSFSYCLATEHARLEIYFTSLVVILYNHTEQDLFRGCRPRCGLWFSYERNHISCISTSEKDHLS